MRVIDTLLQSNNEFDAIEAFSFGGLLFDLRSSMRLPYCPDNGQMLTAICGSCACESLFVHRAPQHRALP